MLFVHFSVSHLGTRYSSHSVLVISFTVCLPRHNADLLFPRFRYLFKGPNEGQKFKPLNSFRLCSRIHYRRPTKTIRARKMINCARTKEKLYFMGHIKNFMIKLINFNVREIWKQLLLCVFQEEKNLIKPMCVSHHKHIIANFFLTQQKEKINFC